MPLPAHLNLFIDPSRCIGCMACAAACSQCESHKGDSMIHIQAIDRARSTQTVPVLCMHCHKPTCAQVCPADAIKRNDDGVVQSARPDRCVACKSCNLGCPFGVPRMATLGREMMVKCDMCYDRSSQGKSPMCASVCPTGAIFFGTDEEIATLRPRSRTVNKFRFGNQTVPTKVRMLIPAGESVEHLDVTAAMHDTGGARRIALNVVEDFFTGAIHHGEPE